MAVDVEAEDASGRRTDAVDPLRGATSLITRIAPWPETFTTSFPLHPLLKHFQCQPTSGSEY